MRTTIGIVVLAALAGTPCRANPLDDYTLKNMVGVTFEAICTLEKLMRTAKSESVRLNAAEAILSRGWGRPTQALQIDERFLTKKLSDLTPDEIKALDERVAMIESDQGVLALTDETESPKPGNIENHEQTAADHP
jgi:hypothetical protein